MVSIFLSTRVGYHPKRKRDTTKHNHAHLAHVGRGNTENVTSEGSICFRENLYVGVSKLILGATSPSEINFDI